MARTCIREMYLLDDNWKSEELLDRPTSNGSPLAGRSRRGTSWSTVLVDNWDILLCNPDRGRAGGDDGRMPVEDVGTGVGYCLTSSRRSSNLRLVGRGRPGEEERGSNAGSSDGRRGAELGASVDCTAALPCTLESVMVCSRSGSGGELDARPRGQGRGGARAQVDTAASSVSVFSITRNERLEVSGHG